MLTPHELTLSEIQEAVASEVPERDCIVQQDRRISYRSFNERSRRLASYFTQHGCGARQERAFLQPWEAGQARIGLLMYNAPEYLEAEFGLAKARAVAVNLNYRYIERELLYLCRNAGLSGLVFHAEFAPKVAALRKAYPQLKRLIQVPDDSGQALLDGAAWYEDALAAGDPADRLAQSHPDDLHLLYTGGTTGMPKGVMWRQADVIMAALGGRHPNGHENQLQDFLHCARASASRTLPAGPFMHASGRWTGMSQILLGNTVVLPANTRHLDPHDIWSTLEREGAAGLNITGDAVARPLLQQLGQQPYRLDRLRLISSGAAALSPSVKQGLLQRLPHIRIADTVGASETGPQATSVVQAGQPIPAAGSPSFSLTSTTTVLREDLRAVLPVSDKTVGWLARSGRVPLGYLGDEAKTRKTFPTLNGVRYAVPGDRARWSEHGAVELLGREAATINTGGEKVFAEEVEAALKCHAAVEDAIVCGRPSERWGEEVVALVRLRHGTNADPRELIDECARHVARYKLPKAIVLCDHIPRSPSGKPDYAWARERAAAAAQGTEEADT